MFDLSTYIADIPTVVISTFVISSVALITQIIFAFIIFRKLARLERLKNSAYSEQVGELDPIHEKPINYSEPSIGEIGVIQKGEEEIFNNPALVGRVLTVNQKGFMQDF